MNKLTNEQKAILLTSLNAEGIIFDTVERYKEFLDSLQPSYISAAKEFQRTKDPAVFLDELHRINNIFGKIKAAIANSGIKDELPQDELNKMLTNIRRYEVLTMYVDSNTEEALSRLMQEKIA